VRLAWWRLRPPPGDLEEPEIALDTCDQCGMPGLCEIGYAGLPGEDVAVIALCVDRTACDRESALGRDYGGLGGAR
jgi:hypothetical protein